MTGRLVELSDCVLTHNSTAISFAVIFSKPALLLVNRDIKESMPTFYKSMLSTSKSLGIHIADIGDKYSNRKNEINLDLDLYLKYKKDYLSNLDTEKKSSEIVTEKLLELLNGYEYNS